MQDNKESIWQSAETNFTFENKSIFKTALAGESRDPEALTVLAVLSLGVRHTLTT
jgi:hypothetical protein